MAAKSKLVEAVESRSVPHLLCLLKGPDQPQGELDEALHLAAWQGQEIPVRMLLAIGGDQYSLSKHGEPLLLVALQSGNIDVVRSLLDEGYNVNYKVGNAAETGLCVPVHLAITLENATDYVQLLLERGARTDTLDMDGDTPLIAACNEQNADVVRLFIGKSVDVNAGGFEGNTALHRAAQLGDVELVGLLLDAHASYTHENASGNTPLLEACCSGQKQTTQLLLAVCGEDKCHVDKNGRNAFHYAAVGGNAELVGVLQEAGVPHNARDGYGNTPLILAAFTKQEAMCAELLGRAPDLDVLSRGESGRTALHWAAVGGLAGLTSALVERDAACVDAEDDNRDTAVNLASKADDMAVARVLCAAGADVMRAGELHRNALHWAVQNKNPDMLRMLMAMKGACADVRDAQNDTPVTYAAMNAAWPLLTALIESEADVNAQGAQDRTALHWVVKNGSREMTRFLLIKGAAHDIRDQYGDTPLSVAIKNIKPGLVPDLLEAGCGVDLPDREGRSPLHVAALYGMTNTVTALLKSGANTALRDKNGNTPLIFACHKSRVKVIDLLLAASPGEAGDAVNAVGKDQKTALYLAVQNRLEKQALALVRRGAAPDLDECVPTPLIQAARSGLGRVATALITAGADVHARDLHHRTALTWAAQGGHMDMLDALLAAGTDPRAVDDSSDTALTVAAFSGKTEAVRRLIPLSDMDHQEREEGMTALHLAISKDHRGCVEALLQAGADINVRDMRSNTALLSAAVHSTGTEALQEVLKCGQPFDIDYKGEKGRSVVHWAVGDPTSLALVLKHGPEINWCDGNGASPILLAIAHEQPKSAKMLIEAGCDFNQVHEDGRQAIHHAALYGDYTTLSLLLEKGVSADALTADSRTPLLLASIEGHARIVRLLLKKGCDVNRVYDAAATALSVAVDYKRYEVVRLLLAAGADPDLIGDKKLTPLKACVVNDDLLGTFLLLQAGAGRAEGTLDAIQAAAIKVHLEVLHLLLALECDVNGVLEMWKGGTIFYFIQDKDTQECVRVISSRPRSLQMLCRQTVRSRLALPLVQNIERLTVIPKRLRDYLKYGDAEKAWFKT